MPILKIPRNYSPDFLTVAVIESLNELFLRVLFLVTPQARTFHEASYYERR
jgi:hypothetical protein